jgi:DNA processing protein
MTPRAGIRLDERQRLDWLRLSRAEGVGPRTFQGLINRFGGAAAALEHLPKLAAARGRTVRIPTLAEAENELRQANRLGIRLLASGEEDYPARLLEIEGPPPILAVRGDVEMLHRPAVALVGARNASASGRKVAARLAAGLAEAGYLVVSGLARGIDAEVHRASLDRGTAAVLAGGLDRPYPPENEALYAEITAKAVAVSEMPLGLSPRGRDFPRRNRLISGLSLGVVVVEAARRSGSLITARMANEQGREVFAVPGSPLDPRCEGSNDLLREGATIVTSVEDIVGVLAPLAGDAARAPRLFREAPAAEGASLFEEWGDAAAAPAAPYADDDEEAPPSGVPEMRLLALIAVDPVEIDVLMRMSGLSARVVRAALVELEIAGSVMRLPGNRVARMVG